jgi:hypothetical protein
MGPRCSSAETQVCHRSYIIAARFPISALSQCEEVEDDPDDEEMIQFHPSDHRLIQIPDVPYYITEQVECHHPGHLRLLHTD